MPERDLDAAYAVQSEIIALRAAGGAHVVGRKIGLTNPKVQAQLGVDQPDFGVLLDDMACEPNMPVDITRLLSPKIEAEIAFVLCADLDQPFISEDEVAAATGHVVAALEIVDSRIADWNITIVDTIADNASSGLFVLGLDEVSLDALDLTAVQMTIRSGEDTLSTGTGAECLGNPLTAVAWLANTARDYGVPLRRGEVILSGALGPMVTAATGELFTADITGIGTVGVSFADPASAASCA
ncbi:fumarylacetoacetate hydrolase family protein [Mycobacterium colombiense]|nr:fumarylacetoacetate hydrolase family protein [Mycobacterium colombiense]MCK8647130.1 fumarylacetoacetate hydrolase family protein [Mycobacterium colombiense]